MTIEYEVTCRFKGTEEWFPFQSHIKTDCPLQRGETLFIPDYIGRDNYQANFAKPSTIVDVLHLPTWNMHKLIIEIDPSQVSRQDTDRSRVQRNIQEFLIRAWEKWYGQKKDSPEEGKS